MDSHYYFRPLRTLTWVATFAVLCRLALDVRMVITLPDTPISSITALQKLAVTDLAFGILSLFLFIPFLVWLDRAACNAHALAPGELDISPGWCVGCWFVPVVNLVAPYFVLSRLWKSSDSKRVATRSTSRNTSTPGLIALFWVLWLVTALWTAFIRKAPESGVVFLMVATATSLLWIWFVWNIDQRQTKCRSRLSGSTGASQESSQEPQLIGQPCVQCGDKIVVAEEADLCRFCRMPAHVTCTAAHRKAVHASESRPNKRKKA